MAKKLQAKPKNLFVFPLALLMVASLAAYASVSYGKSTPAASKSKTYKDANITLQYPQWKVVDLSGNPYKDNLLVAVNNDTCVFMLITAGLPPGSTLKDFITATVAEQSKVVDIKFLAKTIADDYFVLDVTTPLENGVTVRQYAYGVLGSNHAVYQITFYGPEKDFNKTCRPSIQATIKSIKLLQPPSEKADAKKLSEYFKSFALGKLAVGKKVLPPKSVPVKANVFTSKDQFCVMTEIKKDIPVGVLATATYSIETQQNVQEKSANPELIKAGGMTGCSNLEGLPPGRYEFKVYVNDVLAGLYPFVVKK
ncbi:MAG: hypothetical protein WC641_03915 [Patescibacteria group bacterium]